MSEKFASMDMLIQRLKTIPVPQKSQSEKVVLLNRLFAAMDEEKMRKPLPFYRRFLDSLYFPRLALAPVALCLCLGFYYWFSQPTLTTLSAGMQLSALKQTSLTLTILQNTVLTLSPGSRLTVQNFDSGTQRFMLDSGIIELSVGKRKTGQIFEVLTANAICQVVGTRFRVEVSAPNAACLSKVTVSEGCVRFIHRLTAEKSIDVKAGESQFFDDRLSVSVLTTLPSVSSISPQVHVSPPRTKQHPSLTQVIDSSPSISMTQPDPLSVLESEADSYRRARNYDGLIKVLGQIVEIGGNAPKADNALWEIITIQSLAKNDIKAALHSATIYLESFPNGHFAPDALLKRAEWSQSLGWKSDAEAAFRKLLNSYPSTSAAPKAIYGLAMLLGQDFRNYDEATRLLLRLSVEYPDSPDAEAAFFWRAEFTALNGRVSEANNLFKQYLGKYPDGRWAKSTRERLR